MTLDGILTSNGALLEQLALNNNNKRQLIALAIGDGDGTLTAQSNSLNQEKFRTAQIKVFFNRDDPGKIDIVAELPQDLPLTAIKEVGIIDDFNFLHVVANTNTQEKLLRITYKPVSPDAVFAEEDTTPEEITKAFVRAEIQAHNESNLAHSGITQALGAQAIQIGTLSQSMETLSSDSTEQSIRLATVESSAAANATGVQQQQAQVNNLSSQLTALQESQALLSNAVTNNVDAVLGNTETLTSQSETLNQLTTDLNRNRTSVMELDARVGANEGAISEFDDDFNDLVDDVSELEEQQEATSAELEVIQGQVSNSLDRLAVIKTELEASQFDIGALNLSVSGNTNAIVELAQSNNSQTVRLDNIDSSLSSLVSRVSELERKVEEVPITHDVSIPGFVAATGPVLAEATINATVTGGSGQYTYRWYIESGAPFDLSDTSMPSVRVSTNEPGEDVAIVRCEVQDTANGGKVLSNQCRVRLTVSDIDDSGGLGQ